MKHCSPVAETIQHPPYFPERLAELFNYVELWKPEDTHIPRVVHLRQMIIESSRQPHLRIDTPRDASERFVSQASFSIWAASPPKTMVTLSQGDRLAGLIWFGEKGHEDTAGATHTYAGRLYEGFVGRRLSVPFMEVAHRLVADEVGITDVWLEVNATNLPARAAYERFGYTYTPQQDVEGRLLMEYHGSNEAR